MGKAAVVYWTQTGNTEQMAQAVAKGAGTFATEWSDFSADDVTSYDALAFGCPAMGTEELDPDFEALWNKCLPSLGSRPVALFGSYDWGSGGWMETWKDAAADAGVNLVGTVIANLESDADVLAELEALGGKLAE